MQRKSLRSPLRSHRPRSQPREPGAHEVSFHVIVLLVVFLAPRRRGTESRRRRGRDGSARLCSVSAAAPRISAPSPQRRRDPRTLRPRRRRDPRTLHSDRRPVRKRRAPAAVAQVVLIVSLFEGVLIKVKVVDGRVESKPNVENVFALEDAAISAEKRMLRGAVRVEEALGLDKDLAYAAKIAAPAVAAVRREAHLFADVVKHDTAFVEEEIEREAHVARRRGRVSRATLRSRGVVATCASRVAAAAAPRPVRLASQSRRRRDPSVASPRPCPSRVAAVASPRPVRGVVANCPSRVAVAAAPRPVCGVVAACPSRVAAAASSQPVCPAGRRGRGP